MLFVCYRRIFTRRKGWQIYYFEYECLQYKQFATIQKKIIIIFFTNQTMYIAQNESLNSIKRTNVQLLDANDLARGFKLFEMSILGLFISRNAHAAPHLRYTIYNAVQPAADQRSKPTAIKHNPSSLILVSARFQRLQLPHCPYCAKVYIDF